jgi:hypothetical protein
MRKVGSARSRSGLLGVALVVVMGSLGVVGCSSQPPSASEVVAGAVIDHYSLGDPVDCSAYLDPTCEDYLQVARDEITRERDIAASAIASHRLFHESIPGTRPGSSSVVIVVFELADGGRVATGVYCGVGPCHVVGR